MQAGFAGVDWASRGARRLRRRRRRTHRRRAPLSAMTSAGSGRCARGCSSSACGLVAVERPDGLLIERLLDAGLHVIAVHPNQVAAIRRGSAPRAARATASTRSCSPSSRAPTAIASASWSPTRDADQGAARADPRARGPRRHARRAGQRAARPAGVLLARRRGVFADIDSPIAWPSSSATRPRPMPAASANSAWHASWPATTTADDARPRTARAAARRRQRPRRPPRDRGPPPDRPRPRRRAGTARRPDRAADQRDPRRPARPHRRRHLPLAVPRPQDRDLPRHHPGRDGRLPRPLPHHSRARSDGGQSPVAVESGKSKRARFRWACDHRLRDALATLADTSRHTTPGPPTSTTAPAPAAAPPPRHPHPRPRLVRRHLAHLARPQHLRPRPTPRPPTTPHRPGVDTGSLTPFPR